MVPPGAMLAGAALLIAFVWRERGHPEPILPRVVLRNPLVLLSNLDSVMINLAGFAIPLLVPYYLARVGGFGAPAIGVLLAMSTLGVLATTTLAPRLIHALGQRRVAWLGMSVAALGQFAVALWPAAPALPMLCMALLLHGAGFGLFQVSYTDHIIAALPKMDRGVAGSLTILTRTVGVVVSAAVLSSALQSLEAYHLAAGMAPVAAFHAAFAAVFRYTALLLAGYVVLSSVLSAMVRRRSGDVVG